MARKVVQELVDDIDGTPAERTITFAVEGTTYQIDLSRQNLAEFHTAIAGYIDHARTASTPTRRRRTSAPTINLHHHHARMDQIRDWARHHGHTVSDRGRISQDILTAYYHHQPTSTPTEPPPTTR